MKYITKFLTISLLLVSFTSHAQEMRHRGSNQVARSPATDSLVIVSTNHNEIRFTEAINHFIDQTERETNYLGLMLNPIASSSGFTMLRARPAQETQSTFVQDISFSRDEFQGLFSRQIENASKASQTVNIHFSGHGEKAISDTRTGSDAGLSFSSSESGLFPYFRLAPVFEANPSTTYHATSDICFGGGLHAIAFHPRVTNFCASTLGSHNLQTVNSNHFTRDSYAGSIANSMNPDNLETYDLNKDGKIDLFEKHYFAIGNDLYNSSQGSLSSSAFIDFILKEGAYAEVEDQSMNNLLSNIDLLNVYDLTLHNRSELKAMVIANHNMQKDIELYRNLHETGELSTEDINSNHSWVCEINEMTNPNIEKFLLDSAKIINPQSSLSTSMLAKIPNEIKQYYRDLFNSPILQQQISRQYQERESLLGYYDQNIKVEYDMLTAHLDRILQNPEYVELQGQLNRALELSTRPTQESGGRGLQALRNRLGQIQSEMAPFNNRIAAVQVAMDNLNQKYIDKLKNSNVLGKGQVEMLTQLPKIARFFSEASDKQKEKYLQLWNCETKLRQ